MKILKIILNWLLFLAIIAGAWWLFNRWSFRWPVLPHMGGLQVLGFALSLAFVWVEVLKIGSVKPFNCLPCMCGWFSLILAFMFNAEFWYLYLFAGLFVGSVFSMIKMRYS